MVTIKARTAQQHYKTELEVGNTHLLADEPEENGGQGLGPTPTQLLAASLAACTSITLRMYADRKQIAVSEIEVHTRVENEPDSTGFVIQRTIQIKGQLTSEQQQRFIQIANLCPVSKLLSGQTKIITEIV